MIAYIGIGTEPDTTLAVLPAPTWEYVKRFAHYSASFWVIFLRCHNRWRTQRTARMPPTVILIRHAQAVHSQYIASILSRKLS
jgi:hypothetical protein